MWQFLVFCGVFLVNKHSDPDLREITKESLLVVGVILLTLVAIISGWLADTKVGRCKVVQTGLFLTWLGTVLATVGSVLSVTVYTTSNAANGAIEAVRYIALYTTYAGAAIFFTNVVQFGLEQMPDASSDAMTAFISWFVIVTSLGFGSYATVNSLIALNCTNHRTLDTYTYSLRSITGCALLSIGMCSKFLFSHWLIDHRQNHNPLKTVYRVLKFAKQHKYPVNRSAFTYCEDEIPSRIDLGKSKYGGPFTTEEVEDVKTFLRILLVLTVIFAFTIAVLPLQPVVTHFSTDTNCIIRLIFSFEGFFTAAVFMTYEYIVYLCIKIRYRLSILKKIGLCMIYGVLLGLLLFVYSALTEVGLVDINNTITAAQKFTTHWLSFICILIYFKSVVQFIYSQAPEYMKGYFLAWTSVCIAIIVITWDGKLNKCYQSKYCGVYLASAAVAISLLVFVVYCCVARWYKRRERDEPCNERARIEEIYGRHVEHNSIEEQDSD